MPEYLLEMNNITKSYGGVRALDHVNFRLKKGEIHALVGENGAGKSTLIKILGGAIQKDSGELYLDGKPVLMTNPAQAHQLGIRIIYQELVLAPALTAAENIFSGKYPTQFGFWLDRRKMIREAEELLRPFNIHLDLERPLYHLSIAQQQLVEIAKALSEKAQILVMDEPSAVLTPAELSHLFNMMCALKEQGVSIIYISHRLEETFELADRVTVLRDGEVVGTTLTKELDKPQLIRMMVGRTLGQDYPRRRETFGKEVLKIENFSLGTRLKNISFSLRQGEILGIAGLVGAGRTELAHAIFGSIPPEDGTIHISGKLVSIRNPKEAMAFGLAFAPEDRKTQGLILEMAIAANITITRLRKILQFGFLNSRLESQLAQDIVNRLDIRVPTLKHSARQLSGGNQQKVVLGKWLYSQANIFILDEPTRGIDVGAKAQLYAILDQLVRNGAAVIMISSELPEILGMSDRILVMHEGRITGEFSGGKVTEEEILTSATGN